MCIRDSNIVAGAEGITLERVAPAATPCGTENHTVAGVDAHIVHLGRQRLTGAVLAQEPFLRARTRPPAEDAPGLRQVAVVMDRNVSLFKEEIDLLDPVAAAVLTGTTGVNNGGVAVDQHRVIGLQVFARDILE